MDDTAKLGIKNLGGVFVILAAGLVLSMIMALVEFLINAMVNSKSDKVSLYTLNVETFRGIYIVNTKP